MLRRMSDQDGISGRRHRRAQIPLLVQYRFGALDDLQTDYALNVSKSGLFIDTDESHEVGTRVFVQLTSRDGVHFLQGEGRVVRAGDGCAIELVGFDDEAQAVMDQWVNQALAKGQGRQSRPAPKQQAEAD